MVRWAIILVTNADRSVSRTGNYLKGDQMVQMFQQSIGSRETSRWLPAVLVGTVALYFLGYVDGTAQGAFLGSKMAYVHEYFHHARHLAMMCH